MGSRGGQLTELWLNGPKWLGSPENWRESPIIERIASSGKDRPRGLVHNTDSEQEWWFRSRLEKNELRSTLRVTVWILRFVYKCKNVARPLWVGGGGVESHFAESLINISFPKNVGEREGEVTKIFPDIQIFSGHIRIFPNIPKFFRTYHIFSRNTNIFSNISWFFSFSRNFLVNLVIFWPKLLLFIPSH